MFSQNLPGFITSKLLDPLHGSVAQSTAVGTREGIGTNSGRKGRKVLQQPQLRLVYSVREETLKHKPTEINQAE